jgi:putative spermidine/putrescine transport system substrate-binding protein
VLRDPGGPFTAGWGEAFYQPFFKETGIQVIGVTSGADPSAEIRTMVETKNYTWNMAGGFSLSTLNLLVAGGYIEKHGLDDDDKVKQLPAAFRNPYGVGSDIYATAIGYRSDRISPDKAPKTWADYWNVETFKGRRGLRRHPFDLVEEALLADGVPPDKLYPCDLDRAFRAMDRIKAHIAGWFTSGAQATQLITSNEVDLLPVWTTRLMAANGAGVPIAIEWQDNLWDLDVWAILKGTPNADLCREFIRFTCDPQRQAIWTKHVRNGPVHPRAFEYISEDIAKTLPTYPQNLAKGIQIDNVYWAQNKEKAIERFNAWILG